MIKATKTELIKNLGFKINSLILPYLHLGKISLRRAAVNYWGKRYKAGMRIIAPETRINGIPDAAQKYRQFLAKLGMKRIFLTDNFNGRWLNLFLKDIEKELLSKDIGGKILYLNDQIREERSIIKKHRKFSYPSPIDAIIVTTDFNSKYPALNKLTSVFIWEIYEKLLNPLIKGQNKQISQNTFFDQFLVLEAEARIQNKGWIFG